MIIQIGIMRLVPVPGHPDYVQTHTAADDIMTINLPEGQYISEIFMMADGLPVAIIPMVPEGYRLIHDIQYPDLAGKLVAKPCQRCDCTCGANSND